MAKRRTAAQIPAVVAAVERDRANGLAAHALRLAAWSLIRSTSGLGSYLRRQRSRLGATKAITATAHKLARIVYALVRYGGEYVAKSEAEYDAQVRARLERQFKRRAKELGYEVTKVERPAEVASDTPVSAAALPASSE